MAGSYALCKRVLRRFSIKKRHSTHDFDPALYSRFIEGQERFEREEREAALRAGAKRGGMTPATDKEIEEFHAVEDDYGDRGNFHDPNHLRRLGGQHPLGD